jgi:Zn-dependent peptidase ImmA (M78 family)/transcriptional regulator with XRE-family HTH domain
MVGFVKNLRQGGTGLEPKAKQLIGRNLKLAREFSDFSQEDFAGKLGVSRATLSAIENGHVAIDSTKLLLAAQILGRPAADFFKEREEELTLLYRAAEEVVPGSEIRSQFKTLCEGYKELEEIVGVADVLLSPPEYPYLPSFQTRPFHFAEQVAQSERERLGVGPLDRIPNIFKLLENNGVRVFALPIEQQGVFGLSAFSPRSGPCILVNLRNTLERCVFTLAHEYGHLLMHRKLYINRDPAKERDKEIEEMANTFAAHFLVPETGLRDVFEKNVANKVVGTEDVVFLKHHFRVSFVMMLRRLMDSRYIDQKTHTELLEKAKRWQPDATQEPAPLNKESIESWIRVSRFMHLAKKAALEGMVSLGKLAELLGRDITQARGLVNEWRKEMTLVPA